MSLMIVRMTKNSSATSNGKNWVVWREGEESVLCLWNGSTIQKIPFSEYSFFFDINNNGFIAWSAWSDEKEGGVFLWDGKTIRKIVDSNSPGPIKINDKNHIAWSEGDGIYF